MFCLLKSQMFVKTQGGVNDDRAAVFGWSFPVTRLHIYSNGVWRPYIHELCLSLDTEDNRLFREFIHTSLTVTSHITSNPDFMDLTSF